MTLTQTNLNNQRHTPNVSKATALACAERRLQALIEAGRPEAIILAQRAIVEQLKRAA